MDPYSVLGLSKEATDSEVKKAYREMARKYHPDKNDSKDAGETFKNIGAAYEILKDPVKRGEHDMAQKMKSQTTFMSSPRTSFFTYQDPFFTKPFHFNVHNLHHQFYQHYNFQPKQRAQTFVYRNANNYSSNTTSPSEDDEHHGDEKFRNFTSGYRPHRQPSYIYLNNPFNVMNGFMQFQEPIRLKTVFTNPPFTYVPQAPFPHFKQNTRQPPHNKPFHPPHNPPFHPQSHKPKDTTASFYGKNFVHKNVILVDNDDDDSDSDDDSDDDDSDEYDNACDDMVKILEEKISKLEGYKLRKDFEKSKLHSNAEKAFKNKIPTKDSKNTFKSDAENLQGWYFSNVADNKTDENKHSSEKIKKMKNSKGIPDPHPSKSPIQFPCFHCHKRIPASSLSSHEKECMESRRSKQHHNTDAASTHNGGGTWSSKELKSGNKINEKKTKHEEKIKNVKEKNAKLLNDKMKTRNHEDETSTNGFKNNFHHFHFNKDVPPPAPNDPPQTTSPLPTSHLPTPHLGSGDSSQTHPIRIGGMKEVVEGGRVKSGGYFKALHIRCPACMREIHPEDQAHKCHNALRPVHFKQSSDTNDDDSSGKEKIKKNKNDVIDLTGDGDVISKKQKWRSEEGGNAKNDKNNININNNNKNNNTNNNNSSSSSSSYISMFEVGGGDGLVRSTVELGEVMEFDAVDISDDDDGDVVCKEDNHSDKSHTDKNNTDNTDNSNEISDTSYSKSDIQYDENSRGSDDVSFDNEDDLGENNDDDHKSDDKKGDNNDEVEEIREEKDDGKDMAFTNFLYVNGCNKPLHLNGYTVDHTKDDGDVGRGVDGDDDKKYESVMKNGYIHDKRMKEAVGKGTDAHNTYRKMNDVVAKNGVKHKKESGDDVKSKIYIRNNTTINQPEIKKLKNDTKTLTDNIRNIEQVKKQLKTHNNLNNNNLNNNNSNNINNNITVGKRTTIHIKNNTGSKANKDVNMNSIKTTKEVNTKNVLIPKLSAMSTKSTLHPHTHPPTNPPTHPPTHLSTNPPTHLPTNLATHQPNKLYTKNYDSHSSKNQFKNINVHENPEKMNNKSTHNTTNFIKMNKLNYSKKINSACKEDFKNVD